MIGDVMTRINLVHPTELTTKHLVAEYREIMRLPNNLRKSLSRDDFKMSEIPTTYRMGKGHVKFFYDKMLFLQVRFGMLVGEMIRRGYNPKFRDSRIFIPDDLRFYNDYMPDDDAIEINRERLTKGGMNE